MYYIKWRWSTARLLLNLIAHKCMKLAQGQTRWDEFRRRNCNENQLAVTTLVPDSFQKERLRRLRKWEEYPANNTSSWWEHALSTLRVVFLWIFRYIGTALSSKVYMSFRLLYRPEFVGPQSKRIDEKGRKDCCLKRLKRRPALSEILHATLTTNGRGFSIKNLALKTLYL